MLLTDQRLKTRPAVPDVMIQGGPVPRRRPSMAFEVHRNGIAAPQIAPGSTIEINDDDNATIGTRISFDYRFGPIKIRVRAGGTPVADFPEQFFDFDFVVAPVFTTVGPLASPTLGWPAGTFSAGTVLTFTTVLEERAVSDNSFIQTLGSRGITVNIVAGFVPAEFQNVVFDFQSTP